MIVVAVILITLAIVIAFVAREANERRLEADPTVNRLKNRLREAFPVLDNLRVFKGDSSYTIDKKKIYLCVDDQTSGETYDDNTLTFVLLHELAHASTAEIGHGKEFFKTFSNLLVRAKEAGLYDPTKPRPVNYCNSKN